MGMCARPILKLSLLLGFFFGGSTLLALGSSPAPPAQGLLESIQDLEGQAEVLLELERQEADLQLRHGRWSAARKLLRQHLKDDPRDGLSRTLMAEGLLSQERLERCVEEALQAIKDLDPESEYRGRAARVCLMSWMVRGQFDAVDAALQEGGSLAGLIQGEQNVQDAWAMVQLSRARGDVQEARRWASLGVAAKATTWREWLASAYCHRDLGDLVQASRAVVEGMKLTRKQGGLGKSGEPDLLVALGELYFESEQEVEVSGKRSAGSLFKEALNVDPGHPGALLGLHAMHRLNRRRVSQSPEEILATLMSAHPRSIEGLVRRTEDDLADGHLPHVRKALKELRERAGGRRDVQTLRAAIAFVEHRRDECEALLEGLTTAAPLDSTPERSVGLSLLELYRFAEALPFLQRAVERDPQDHHAWVHLARSLANVGREDEAREALSTSVRWAEGRQNAWRDNLAAVLNRMHKYHTREDHGPLQFSWQPDAAAVFRAYWVPYYAQAREELAERYGFTPGTTTIEIFREHADFSVRSVGFEGFPALGVCFGPVITSLSPLSNMRGRFSWARTGFHEFSHVIHLGLSHNRCPRWITEGLATWEEVNRNPAWTRNMRKELLDARAGGQLILVRDLNRAFRGPRILFGYYQGGLLCEMLIAKHGFSPMVRLLEAFDRGEDLDQAIRGTFHCTPEDIDREFAAFVDKRLEGLQCEPLHEPGRMRRLALRLASEAPTNTGSVEEPSANVKNWVQNWLTVAYGHWQQRNPVDAAEALRRAASAGVDSAREQFLRAALALENRDMERAEAHWRAGFEMGGREYRSLIAMSLFLASNDRLEEALQWLVEAETSFPGYDEAKLSAELNQAEIYDVLGRDVEAMAARERWLAYNPGNYDMHWKVGLWHRENGRYAEASELFEKANEVDPFHRDLHLEWGACLEKQGRLLEAVREFEVALVVPAELDGDHFTKSEQRAGPAQAQALSQTEIAAILTRLARLRKQMGEETMALELLDQALEAQPDLEEALKLKEQW
ncbi:MAG: tetratricopeptide (TPR) repeat protein [Glaciecola sp.]|jgi:tetratricopeptide (TPR) repeat protein